MKLIQLNIWQGRLLRQVLKFLEQERPDFLCMQEVYSSEIHTMTHDFFGSFEAICALLPGYHAYFSPSFGLTVFDQKVRYGNALLSRFPLTDSQTIYTNAQFRIIQSAAEFAACEGQLQPYNLQRVVVDVGGGKSFCLINHHGYWEPDRMGSEISVRKMEQVSKVIKASPGRWCS